MFYSEFEFENIRFKDGHDLANPALGRDWPAIDNVY